GGAVDQPPHLAARNAQGLQAAQHRGGLVARPRRDLGDGDPAGGGVDGGEVGEGAPHVDSDDEHAGMIAESPLTVGVGTPRVSEVPLRRHRSSRRTDAMPTTTAQDIRHLWTHRTQDHPWLADEELVVERAEGVWVWTQQGKKLLDGFAGLAVVNVGHGRREIAEAIAEQTVRLAYYPTTRQFSNRPAAELAAKLAALTPRDLHYTMFAVSGPAA